MLRRFELDDRQFAKQSAMSGRRPDIVQRAFHFEPVATEAGAGEGHRAALAVVVVDRSERRRVEPERLLEIQPRDELMHLRFERRRVVIAQHVAGMSAAATILGQLYGREPRGLDASRRQDLSLVPAEAPERRPDAIATRIKRGEFLKVRVERFVFVTKDADRTLLGKRAHAVVSAVVEMPLLARRREIGIGLLVLQQDGITVQEDDLHDVLGGERDPLVDRFRRLRPSRNGEIERMIGRLDILRQIDVRDVERVAVLVEAVRRPVRRQAALQGDAGQIEQVADRVLVLDARQTPDTRPACSIESRSFGRDQRLLERLQERVFLNHRRSRLFLRWHLTRFDAVMDFDPPREAFRIGVQLIELERCQIQSARLRRGIMAIEAMRLEKTQRLNGTRHLRHGCQKHEQENQQQS